MKHVARVFALLPLALAACAHASSSTGRSTSVQRQTAAYPTYALSAAFEKNGPSLTTVQRAWIAQVIHSKNYGRYGDLLRFSPVRGRKTPVVVFVEPSGDVDPGVHISSPILGETCNTYFDPYERGVFAAPGDAACAQPTLKPVE